MRNKRIGVLTGTRAEYGLLRHLMSAIHAESDMQLQLFVTGSHLVPQFGSTVDEIIADGFVIDETIDMLLASDTPAATVKSLGLGIIGFADALARQQPDMVIVLGDRYEALGFAQAAALMQIPIIHLHGGEVSEGAVDDVLRHAITKLSSWHVVSAESHRRRVIQLGEAPDRVFNFGAIGLDRRRLDDVMAETELKQELGLAEQDTYVVVTYHPATALTYENPLETFQVIVTTLLTTTTHKLIISYPNADARGREIINAIDQFKSDYPARIIITPSLGERRYLSAVRFSQFVIGNSSSGLIEAPALGVPTINVGERQKGRLHGESVINTNVTAASIEAAITLATSDKFKHQVRQMPLVYGAGNICERIIKLIRNVPMIRTKSFYDIELDDIP